MKKQQNQLLTTDRYEMFSAHENQREINNRHVHEIAQIMREQGFWPYEPIGVYLNDLGKFVIIDGHHRFNAAKLAGIPVFFVITQKDHKDNIGIGNAVSLKWSARSFVDYYASKGIADYAILLKYAKRGFPLMRAAGLLSGQVSSSNISKSVPSGTFKVKSTEQIDAVINVLESVNEIAPNITLDYYVSAISSLLFVTGFYPDVLIEKIVSKPSLIKKCANKEQALEILQMTYNHRAKDKLPLVFLAKESARKRGGNTQKTGMRLSKSI